MTDKTLSIGILVWFGALIWLIKGTAWGLWHFITSVARGHALMGQVVGDWFGLRPRHVPQNPRMRCRWDDQRKTMMTLCPASHSLGTYCLDCLPARLR